MSEQSTKSPAWLQEMGRLLDELSQADIAELEVTQGRSHILVRRGVVVPKAQIESGRSDLSGDLQDGRKFSINAPLTGILYLAASPQEAPYVVLGEWVREGQVVALIEAMKVFNEIRTEEAGRVIEIAQESGQVVHEGDVLMVLERV
jgi:biotin carboxyl carrier protein